MRIGRHLTGFAVAGFIAAAPALADVIGYEDFDGGAINLSSTTNVFDFGAGGGTGGDVFGRVSPWNGGTGTGGPFDVWDDSVVDTSGGGVFAGDTRAIAGQRTTAFFSSADADGFTPNVNDATWTFDISSAISITDITIDIAALGDFEVVSLDGFVIRARTDANAYVEIFRGVCDEAASKVYRPMDNGVIPLDTNDPLELFIDGVATGTFLDKCDPSTGLFDRFTSLALAGASGSTLDIQIAWEGTPSSSEPMGFDNFTINGVVPEPASLLLLSLGLVALRRR